MGCCILGALIISRWLYVARRVRLSLASFHGGGTRMAMTWVGSRRSTLIAAGAAIEMALFATVAGYELTGHLQGAPSRDADATTDFTIALAAIDAICARRSP